MIHQARALHGRPTVYPQRSALQARHIGLGRLLFEEDKPRRVVVTLILFSTNDFKTYSGSALLGRGEYLKNISPIPCGLPISRSPAVMMLDLIQRHIRLSPNHLAHLLSVRWFQVSHPSAVSVARTHVFCPVPVRNELLNHHYRDVKELRHFLPRPFFPLLGCHYSLPIISLHHPCFVPVY